MIEVINLAIQQIGVWIAIVGPLIYLILVASFITIIIALLVGKRNTDN